MWPVNKVKRLWRGRGHGVHSPFAYRFITNVLRLKGRYYASDELERMPDPRWHTLLFRLVCEFEPERVAVPDGFHSWRSVIGMADSRAEVLNGDPDVVLMYSQKGVVTVFRDIDETSGEWERKRASMLSGMTFTDGRMAVAVERADLPRQDFEIDFRL